MELRSDLITEYKHLKGGKIVASKKLLNLTGRGVIRKVDKKSTPEKIKLKTAIKN